MANGTKNLILPGSVIAIHFFLTARRITNGERYKNLILPGSVIAIHFFLTARRITNGERYKNLILPGLIVNRSLSSL